MADFTEYLYAYDALIIVLAAIMRVWYTLGGWPEAYFRIFRKDYFVPVIREPDGRKRRWVLPGSRIHSHSKASFTLNWRTGKEADGGEYLIEADKQSRSNGRPSWDYTYDDCRPIPQDPGESRCDPINVHKAITNKVVNDIHREGAKPRKRGRIWLAIIAVSIIGLASYYAWYFHDLQCKAGHC